MNLKQLNFKDKIKANWKRFVLFFGTVPGVIWLALRWPYLVVGLATIPVESYISQRFNITPVTSKFIGLGIFFGLMAISWWSMEAVVLLAAFAIGTDLILMKDKITARFSMKPVVAQELIA